MVPSLLVGLDAETLNSTLNVGSNATFGSGPVGVGNNYGNGVLNVSDTAYMYCSWFQVGQGYAATGVATVSGSGHGESAERRCQHWRQQRFGGNAQC